MGQDLFFEYQRTLGDRVTQGRYFGVRAVCGKPKDIGFNVHGSGVKDADPADEQALIWKRGNGVDAFIEFDCGGYTSHPAAFEAKPVRLLVNALGSLDRFALADRGAIGDGCHDGNEFLLRLYLDPPTSKQLLAVLTDPSAL